MWLASTKPSATSCGGTQCLPTTTLQPSPTSKSVGANNLLRFMLNSLKIPCRPIRLEQERQAQGDHYCHESSAGPFTNIYQLKTIIHQIFIL